MMHNCYLVTENGVLQPMTIRFYAINAKPRSAETKCRNTVPMKASQ